MKVVVAVTGASGSMYAQRLLEQIAKAKEVEECHVVLSEHAQEVAATELGAKGLTIPKGMKVHGDKTMQVPFASGSASLKRWPSSPVPWGLWEELHMGIAMGRLPGRRMSF